MFSVNDKNRTQSFFSASGSKIQLEFIVNVEIK